MDTSYESIVQKLQTFRVERGWVGLAPEDLVKSIILEAAELLEHYQWDTTDMKKRGATSDKDMAKIATEVADIFIYTLEFCQENNIDLLEITNKKIEHNIKKYPAQEMKDGGNDSYLKAKQSYRRKQ